MKKGLSLNSHLGHNSDVGAKEYETIPGASMGSKMIRVKMPIGLFLLAQFVLIESKFSQTVNFFSLIVILSNKDGKTLVLNQF